MRVLVVILRSLVLAFCRCLHGAHTLPEKGSVRHHPQPQLSAYLYVINYRMATAYLHIRLFNTSFRPYALRHGFLLAPAPKTAPKRYRAAFLPASMLHNARHVIAQRGQSSLRLGPFVL